MTTQTTYTPGPWEAKFQPFSPSHTIGKRAANGSLDLIADLANSVPQLDERQANARLIAAAPDLLNALAGLAGAGLDLCDRYDEEDVVGAPFRLAIKQAVRALAIAQAEGGTKP